MCGLSSAHHLHSLCLPHGVYDTIYFPLAADGTDSPQWVTHTHTQHYIQGHTARQFMGAHTHTHTHSSHAFAGSHTVDSPSSAGVINDFLWLPSNSSFDSQPSFTPPTSTQCYLCPSFKGERRLRRIQREQAGSAGQAVQRDRRALITCVCLPRGAFPGDGSAPGT